MKLELNVKLVCVCVCEMNLHKHAPCWMLIRNNKTSIKDLFWRGRRKECWLIERGRWEVCVWGWGVRALRFVSQSGLYQRHLFPFETHTHTHRGWDSVHFNSPVTSSYDIRRWLLEQTLIFSTVFRACWQAQARANWLVQHNYRYGLCSGRAEANLSTTSLRPSLSKCHLDRAALQARQPGSF